ncbi:MAG: hypothetical protein M1827_007087 [Pycnora praestabilis]|nr:MAG: hypothetical protein M1827_007087 [Pycnora praestabilis]
MELWARSRGYADGQLLEFLTPEATAMFPDFARVFVDLELMFPSAGGDFGPGGNSNSSPSSTGSSQSNICIVAIVFLPSLDNMPMTTVSTFALLAQVARDIIEMCVHPSSGLSSGGYQIGAELLDASVAAENTHLRVALFGEGSVVDKIIKDRFRIPAFRGPKTPTDRQVQFGSSGTLAGSNKIRIYCPTDEPVDMDSCPENEHCVAEVFVGTDQTWGVPQSKMPDSIGFCQPVSQL